ncbi:MAG: DUF1836 domain-containing protein [Anaerotruncus sp.]|nr:DUF1836 domain-containing protein [Anaerotruncus sp.]
MDLLESWMQLAFLDADLTPGDLPKLDLYMDQILTLFDEGLAANKRRPSDKLLTKTMINNYSKEHLIMPVRGKKYTRTQMMQLLCILNLKQNLNLADIKALMGRKDASIDFEAAYAKSLEYKENLRQQLPVLLQETFGKLQKPPTEEQLLAMLLALSSGATFLRRLCETAIDKRQENSAS